MSKNLWARRSVSQNYVGIFLTKSIWKMSCFSDPELRVCILTWAWSQPRGKQRRHPRRGVSTKTQHTNSPTNTSNELDSQLRFQLDFIVLPVRQCITFLTLRNYYSTAISFASETNQHHQRKGLNKLFNE